MSSAMNLPLGPLPEPSCLATEGRSRPASRASFFASGDANTREPAAEGGAGLATAAADTAGTGAAAGTGAEAALGAAGTGADEDERVKVAKAATDSFSSTVTMIG